jgi:hypothetical protein
LRTKVEDGRKEVEKGKNEVDKKKGGRKEGVLKGRKEGRQKY